MAAFGANGKLPISLPSFRSAPPAVVRSSTEMRLRHEAVIRDAEQGKGRLRSGAHQQDGLPNRRVMTTRRKDDETVPDRVLERQPRPDVKRCADRIQHTPGHD